VCGTISVDGRDVSDILIGKGLAHPCVCGGDQLPAGVDRDQFKAGQLVNAQIKQHPFVKAPLGLALHEEAMK
jgi:hypothetical protein